jgi:hypothetical protein
MIYEPDASFDLDAWREEIGADNRVDRSPMIPALLKAGPLNKADLAKAVMAELKVVQSTAYYLIEKAEKRKIIKRNKKSGLYEVT